MADKSVIKVDDLELNEQEAHNISEIIFEQKIAKGDLTKIHAVITGIQAQRKIPFVGLLALVGECIESCDIPEGAGIKMSEKKWNPKTIGYRLEHCSKDLSNLVSLLKKKINKFLDAYDFSGSEEEAIILMRAEEATETMLWRLLHFGDTEIAHQADGGSLNDTIALKYFNCIDGLWKLVFSNYGPSINGGKYYVPIAENAGVDYDAQELASDTAYKTFKAMHKAADSRLKRSKNKVLLATRTLIENWLDYLEEKSLANTTDAKNLLATQAAEDGNTFLISVFRGTSIYVVDNWDVIISSYFDNGTKLDKPHRALLTTADNIPIGTPSKEMLGSLDSFFDRKDKKNYVDSEIEIDVVLLEDYMGVSAY